MPSVAGIAARGELTAVAARAISYSDEQSRADVCKPF